MFARLRKSRGWVRFRRNRSANIAMWVIGAYLLLAAWIWTTEGAQSIGKNTGWWDISDRPLLGMFLPDRTLERVGPAQVAGFGLEQSVRERTNHADWLVKFVGGALQDVDRLPADSLITPAQVLARARLSERRIAREPPEQIRAWHSQAGALFENIDSARRAGNSLSLVRVRLAALKGRLAEASRFESDDATGARSYRTLLLNAAEDLQFAVEDAVKVVAADDPLSAIELDPIRSAVDDLSDAPPDLSPEAAAAMVPREWLKELERDDKQSAVALERRVEQPLKAIEGLVAQMLPMPTGFEGTLYKFRLSLGTDRQGRSIMVRSLYSAKIAIQVGAIVALVSVIFGATLGSAAAFYGGWIDHAVIWLYSSLSSLPQLVLLAVLSFMFIGSPFEKTLLPVYAAFCLTFWIGPCRVIRGEVLKIRQLEYAQAATAIGFDRPYILLRHIMPNTAHLMFINFSLLFIGAIKSEVILTFLGLGIKEGSSWGIMISQSQPEVVNGFFWQIGAATVFMLVLVLAFNVVSDALQDAFDPKHVG